MPDPQQSHPELRDIPVARSTAILILRVVGDISPPREPWAVGPYPWLLPRKDNQYLYRDRADEQTRNEYFEPRVRPLLYGHIRWHRDVPTECRLDEWTVTAAELLKYPADYGPEGALFIVHLQFDAPDVEAMAANVARLANMRPTATSEVSNLDSVRTLAGDLLSGVEVAFQRTAYVISHMTTSTGLDDAGRIQGLSDTPAPYGVSRLLASANEVRALPAELQTREPGVQDIGLSTSWVATVLRAGCAFVGRTSEVEDGYHDLAEVLVHTLYLDSLLVGLIQRDCIEERTNRLVSAWEPNSRIKDIARQERQIINLRGQAWWLEIAQAENPNRLLSALQIQFRLPDQLDRLNRDVMDLARITDAARQERTNRLLNILVIASAALGLAALIADPGRTAVLWGLGLAIATWLIISLAGRDRP